MFKGITNQFQPFKINFHEDNRIFTNGSYQVLELLINIAHIRIRMFLLHVLYYRPR